MLPTRTTVVMADRAKRAIAALIKTATRTSMTSQTCVWHLRRFSREQHVRTRQRILCQDFNCASTSAPLPRSFSHLNIAPHTGVFVGVCALSGRFFCSSCSTEISTPEGKKGAHAARECCVCVFASIEY